METKGSHPQEKINFDYLDDLAGGEPQVLKSLLQMIQKHLATYPDIIVSAFKDGDNQRVAEQAHKFKSSVIYLRVKQFDENLEALESIWQQSIGQDEVQGLLDRLAGIVAHVQAQAADKVNELGD
jgi:HPt (histidine-containing phosphotransfer) domain-containing protein